MEFKKYRVKFEYMNTRIPIFINVIANTMDAAKRIGYSKLIESHGEEFANKCKVTSIMHVQGLY